MGKDVNKRGVGSISNAEHLSVDNWMLVKAITTFKCEHDKCQTSIIEDEFFILFMDSMREKNLCIKHGIQKVKEQRKMLEVFETKVKKRKNFQ